MNIRSGGFTLIELLIVIAIIAILALIAIPNFVEAQTRSKVSRALADMRSIATAIEAYQVDENSPPLGLRVWKTWDPKYMDLTEEECREQMWSRLTTPIAYITTVPLNPFALRVPTEGNPGKPRKAKAWQYFDYESVHHRHPQGASAAQDQAYAILTNPNSSITAAANRGVKWFMYSLGPARREQIKKNYGRDIHACAAKKPSTSSSLRYPDLIYDPTNGTNSFGYLWRCNLGDLQ